MNEYEKYMNDPDIIDEPMALREVHAIRLMLHEKTENMTPEEHTQFVHEQTKPTIEKYGLKVRREIPKAPPRPLCGHPTTGLT
jgi:hypothetical protein